MPQANRTPTRRAGRDMDPSGPNAPRPGMHESPARFGPGPSFDADREPRSISQASPGSRSDSVETSALPMMPARSIARPGRTPHPRGGGTLAGLLVWLALALTAPVAASAATGGPDATWEATRAEPAGLPSASQIEARLAEITADSALDEATRTALTEQYRRALSNLEAAQTFDSKAADFAQVLKTAPGETTAILERLADDRSSGRAVPEIPEALPADQLAERLNRVMADASIEETRISELDKVIEGSVDRPAAARARIAEIRGSLDQVAAELDQPAAGDQTPLLAEAREWALETRRHALWAEARMLEQELLSQSAREALRRAQRDEANLKWQALRAEQRGLEELQNQRRRAEAEAAQRESERAQLEAADKHPLVQQATRDNAEITASTGEMARRLENYDEEIARHEAEHKRVEQDFKASEQRIEAAGLSKALGQVLIERRDQLPDLRQYRRAIESRQDEIAEATLNQIRHREEQRRLGDLDRYLEELTAGDERAQTDEVREQLAQALEQRVRLLEQAIAVEDAYIRQLGELNYAAERLIQVTAHYDEFLAERLLWVRSSLPVGLPTLANLPPAVAWLLEHEHWSQVTQVLLHQGRRSPLFWLGLAILALLFAKHAELRSAIRSTAEPLRKIRTDRLAHTALAIGLSLVAALPLPLLFWLLGVQLSGSGEATDFTRAFGAALGEISLGLYFLLAFRMLCLAGGVADRHFRWSQATLTKIRREVHWFTLFVVPVSLVSVTLYKANDPTFSASLGRLAFVAVMIGFTLFYARLLSPGTGVLSQTLKAHPQGWLNRSRHLWFSVIVGAPVGLTVLALLGYVYTAGILFESLVQQTWLALALVMLHQVIVRWLSVTRRRLALQAALDRQAVRRAQAAAERSETPAATSLLQVEEPEPDLAALDEQTRRLINASLFFAAILGLWVIWSDVLPALSILQRIPLWHSTEAVAGKELSVPVTAADLGLVLVILVVAAVAAKNLPALLEILLLQTASVSAGGRFAIKTLVTYGITLIAFLTAFTTLGLKWSQVQWLVAALGVGIGFGLQEIVANFISGIIILFERPVRVGDIVTIGDTTGVVTNIQIRAITIRNWDKQELLVPNKEFITGRLLNWTLTDQQNRITIPVGIEYGSDTRKALGILSDVARQHPRVLDDPAPLISFEGFGDNALTLVLRCYLDAVDIRIGVTTELHQAIYDRFAENGIGIAFPQRDVHLIQRGPLDIRVQRPADPPDRLTGRAPAA